MQSTETRLFKAAKRTFRAEVTLIVIICIVTAWSIYALYKFSAASASPANVPETIFGFAVNSKTNSIEAANAGHISSALNTSSIQPQDAPYALHRAEPSDTNFAYKPHANFRNLNHQQNQLDSSTRLLLYQPSNQRNEQSASSIQNVLSQPSTLSQLQQYLQSRANLHMKTPQTYGRQPTPTPQSVQVSLPALMQLSSSVAVANRQRLEAMERERKLQQALRAQSMRAAPVVGEYTPNEDENAGSEDSSNGSGDAGDEDSQNSEKNDSNSSQEEPELLDYALEKDNQDLSRDDSGAKDDIGDEQAESDDASTSGDESSSTTSLVRDSNSSARRHRPVQMKNNLVRFDDGLQSGSGVSKDSTKAGQRARHVDPPSNEKLTKRFPLERHKKLESEQIGMKNLRRFRRSSLPSKDRIMEKEGNKEAKNVIKDHQDLDHILEDLPFNEAIKKGSHQGARIGFGRQPERDAKLSEGFKDSALKSRRTMRHSFEIDLTPDLSEQNDDASVENGNYVGHDIENNTPPLADMNNNNDTKLLYSVASKSDHESEPFAESSDQDVVINQLLMQQQLEQALQTARPEVPSPQLSIASFEPNFVGADFGAVGANNSNSELKNANLVQTDPQAAAGSLFTVDHGLLLHQTGAETGDSLMGGHKKSKQNKMKKTTKKMMKKYKKGGEKHKKVKKDMKKMKNEKAMKSVVKGKKVEKANKKKGKKIGSKKYMDKGYKKHGFKKEFHRVESGKDHKYFDEFRDKDFKKKYEAGESKYKKHKMKKYAGKDIKKAKKAKEHSESFKNFNKGRWKKKYSHDLAKKKKLKSDEF